MLNKLKQFITQDFNSEFFEENQKTLLFIANKWYLSWLLGLNRLPKDFKKQKGNNKFTKIDTAGISWFTGKIIKKGKKIEYECAGAYFTRPRFAEALAFNLSPFAYLKDSRQKNWQWRFSPVGAMSMLLMAFSGVPIFFGTTTSYSVGSGDGRIYKFDGTFSTARNAASGNASYTNTADTIGIESSGGWYIERCFSPTDTSGLGSGATISSATYNFYHLAAVTDTNSSDCDIVETTQASTSELVNDDYDNVEFGTSYGSLALSSMSGANNWEEITFSDTSIISKTGVTKIGLINSIDNDNGSPSGSNSIGNYVFSNYTGTDKDPYLSITYTVVTTDIKSINGVAYADIKSVNGLAKASIKSINGLE